MIKVIFEDHPDAPISKIIRSAYKECNPRKDNEPYVFNENDNIWFAKGNGHVLNFIKKHYKRENSYLVYFDLVPDNVETDRLYTRLIDYINDNGLYNIIVVPVRGIEYYVLLELIDLYKDEQLKKRLSTIEYRGVSKEKNLENYYKEILEQHVQDCAKIKGSLEFYKQDCLCSNKLGRCLPITVEEKGKLIVRKLPMHMKFDGDDVSISIDEIKSRIEELLEEYYRLKSVYKELGYC